MVSRMPQLHPQIVVDSEIKFGSFKFNEVHRGQCQHGINVPGEACRYIMQIMHVCMYVAEGAQTSPHAVRARVLNKCM